MHITSKKGDRGKTSLSNGRRVYKDTAHIEAYGDIDELCSFLGMAKSLLKSKKAKGILESVQKDLFAIGAEIANKGISSGHAIKKSLEYIEDITAQMEKKLISQKRCFYIPGEDTASAAIDIARAAARRAERRVIHLLREEARENTDISAYFNRLSDMLFLLARDTEKRHKRLK